MALDQRDLRETLEGVFARQDMYEACQRRDVGMMVRILSKYGITQGQIAGLTGIAQGRLSEYKRGRRQAEDLATFEKVADGLSMPARLRQAMGLTAPGGMQGTANHTTGNGLQLPTDTFDLQLLAEAIGKRGDDVKRREMLGMAAKVSATAMAAQSEVWEQLDYALSDSMVLSEATVREMEARTAGFHRLEEMLPGNVIFRGLSVHIKEVSTLLRGSAEHSKKGLRNRLISTAGESCVLAGWIASDMGSTATARNFYDTAERAAKEAGDPAIVACAYGYRSYIPSGKGNHGRARALLGNALELVSDSISPATVAWLAARHAEESGALGDTVTALRSWHQAEDAFHIADTADDRVWTRFLDENRLDSFRISTYSKIGKLEEAEEAARQMIARLPELDKKRTAIILGDLASAHLVRGSVTEAARLAREGLAASRDIESAIWLPRFDVLAQGLRRWQHQQAVRVFLEDLAKAKSGLA
ncbi:helix-turn-helix transcriptional regulator [Nonomuraea dietziae]|uniref:helix-turn-helix domain-containing protein n=1 Tax=Nonomuraea dietziae TaxID=65515 RepID=UPI0033E04DA1